MIFTELHSVLFTCYPASKLFLGCTTTNNIANSWGDFKQCNFVIFKLHVQIQITKRFLLTGELEPKQIHQYTVVCRSLNIPGQITCFVEFPIENKLTHPL